MAAKPDFNERECSGYPCKHPAAIMMLVCCHVSIIYVYVISMKRILLQSEITTHLSVLYQNSLTSSTCMKIQVNFVIFVDWCDHVVIDPDVRAVTITNVYCWRKVGG